MLNTFLIVDKYLSRFQNVFAHLDNNDKDIFNLNHQVSDLSRQVSDLSRQVSDLSCQISDLDSELVGQISENKRLTQDLIYRDAEIFALYSSRSWKITSPLRWGGLQFRNIQGLCGLILRTFRLGGGFKRTIKKILNL